MKANLLKKTEYEALLKAINEQDALRILSGTAYASLSSSLSTEEFSISKFERALLESYYAVYEHVMSFTVGKARAFLQKVYQRYEMTCLKSIIRIFYADVPRGEAMIYITPTGSFSFEVCTDLLRKRELREVVEEVREPELKIKLLEAMKDGARLHSSLPLECVIDKFCFTTLWELANQLQGWDKPPVIRILGMEIDLANIIILLRTKSMGLDIVTTKNFLIPIRYKLGSEFESALNMLTALDALRILATGYYSNPLLDTLSICEEEGTILPVELALRRHYLKENLKVFAGYPFHVGLLLAYLNLKYYEIGDIRAVIVGKFNRLPPEKIKDLLTLYELVG
jgi:V/A-type H+-transporting ATPase subunit C